ncbi:hypothetical protein ACHAWU_003217 [Discostella pseudostelligera]|uniref:Uncharacterized protein n=1 Tax=Discostella pseudostelligera TaxID=259834 RepID=A0ABD3N4C0_9STRA
MFGSASNSVSGGGGGGGGAAIKDFSVDAQRRMFIEKQALEKQLAEEARSSRKHKQSSSSSSIRKTQRAAAGVIGDDDDDSIHHDDDEFSLDSEESFYVGIERADYTQPDNLALYGGGRSGDGSNGDNADSLHENWKEEDRLGISHVSIAIIHRQDGGPTSSSTTTEKILDWDADIPILHDEKSRSSLHAFMNGSSGAGLSNSKKDVLVAMPLVGSSGSGTTNLLQWKEENKLNDDKEGDDTTDQVYQHKAAEGKMFIDKILSAPTNTTSTMTSNTDAASSSSMRSAVPAVGLGGDGGEGTYPTLSPLQMYIPGITTAGSVPTGGGGKPVPEGEVNFMRQMRERELRKEEAAKVVARTMQEMREMIAAAASTPTDSTDEDSTAMKLVDANALMKKLEEFMVQ